MPFYLCSPTSDFCNSYSTSRFTNVVRSGSLCDARRMASFASIMVTPSISNKIFPGRTTATQWSGAPLPLPIRVSAGFLVTGLSGNSRIQILPPRFTKRVIATRLASIWRSVIHPGSSTFSPNWPKASVLPRQALPVMRPRCCLRYLTFFGINIVRFPVETGLAPSQPRQAAALLKILKCSCGAHFARRRCFALFRWENFAFINPALYANHAIRGARLGESVIDIGAQRVQRQPPLQIPLRTGDFIAIQPSAHANFDSFAAETQRRIDRLAHRPPES